MDWVCTGIMGEQPRHSVNTGKTAVRLLVEEIRQFMDGNGYLSWSEKEYRYVLLGTNSPRNGLVDCPQCKIGRLMMIRSRTTGKRFIGCSNYINGCTVSSPLLQKARLRCTKKPCQRCRWPMVIFRYSVREKWTRRCSNINCDSQNAS